MKEVFIVADNIISPLGNTTAENFAKLVQGILAVKQHTNIQIADEPFYAALFDTGKNFTGDDSYTKFEQLLIASITNVLQQSGVNPADKKTLLIISTTKGNISLLETEVYNESLKKRMALHTSANLVANIFILLISR
jgi:3-oxoacyl-[acyl-carrier-protein] synthase-1